MAHHGYPMGQQPPPPGPPGVQQYYGQGQGWNQPGQTSVIMTTGPGGQTTKITTHVNVTRRVIPANAGAGQQQFQQYQQQCYTHWGEPSQHYGRYGNEMQKNVFNCNAAQAFGYNSDQELLHMFNHYASQKLGGIQGEELVNIMNNTPQIRNYYKINWSLELCKVMIAMLDRDRNGIMGWPEFLELQKCLVYWYRTFCQYDGDRSGYIEANELFNVIKHNYGYIISQKTMETLLKRYSKALEDGRCLIAFDDFVSLSVRLRAYTEAFRQRDRLNHGQETGQTTFQYDDFLQCVMCL